MTQEVAATNIRTDMIVANDYTAEYQDAADKVNSGMFYSDHVTSLEFAEALQQFINASKELDKFKKVLFRGRTRSLAGLRPLGATRLLHQVVGSEYADLVHGIVGVCTESGECAEILLHVIAGDAVDIVNVKEEAGDMLWYINRLLRWAKTTFPAEMRRNIHKLTGRHGETFNAEGDVNRDLANERKILES